MQAYRSRVQRLEDEKAALKRRLKECTDFAERVYAAHGFRWRSSQGQRVGAITGADLWDIVRGLREMLIEKAAEIRRLVGDEHEETAAELDACLTATADCLEEISRGK